MKIGILYEGKLDLPSIKIIVDRIIGLNNDWVPYKAGGPIITKMGAAVTLFCDKSVDLAVFVSDIDNCVDRRNIVRDFIKLHSEIKTIPIFCDPHFEEWFVVEQNAMKSILSIDPQYSFNNDPLRNNPKSLVLKFIFEKFKKDKETQLLEPDFYQKISESLDIKVLSKNSSDFRNFKEELDNFIKNVTIIDAL